MDEPLQSPVERAFDETLPANLTWEQQLVMLRALSERMGVLHEAQALQLKYWPFAVDPDLPHEGQETHVDLEGGLVRYVWLDPDRNPGWVPPEDYRKRLKVLAKWTRWMLGAKFRVEVKLNNETIFVKDRDRKKRKKRARKGGTRKKKR